MGQVINRKLNINLSDFFSRLVKDAARCNRYNSDVVYDIMNIMDKMKDFDTKFDPIFIGFRRHGVDCTSFVLERIKKSPYDVYNEYFALYSISAEEQEPGSAVVTINEYWM